MQAHLYRRLMFEIQLDFKLKCVLEYLYAFACRRGPSQLCADRYAAHFLLFLDSCLLMDMFNGKIFCRSHWQ